MVLTILTPTFLIIYNFNNSPMSTHFEDSLDPPHLDQWAPLPSFIPHYCRLVNQRDVTERGALLLPLLVMGASCRQFPAIFHKILRHKISQEKFPAPQNIPGNPGSILLFSYLIFDNLNVNLRANWKQFQTRLCRLWIIEKAKKDPTSISRVGCLRVEGAGQRSFKLWKLPKVPIVVNSHFNTIIFTISIYIYILYIYYNLKHKGLFPCQ